MSLEQAARRGLTALFAALGGSASFQRAELALSLHMLEFLAPRFFDLHALVQPQQRAFAALDELPTAFGPHLDVDEAMARLDGLYLSAVRGRPARAFDAEALKGCVERAEQQRGRLWRWLMGELASRVGAQAAMVEEERWPFRAAPIDHLYHLTHLVLLDTDFLLRPVPGPRFEELGQLQQAMGPLIAARAWDLLAECAFCLNRAGIAARPAIEALRGAQQPDGSFAVEDSSPRMAAHCTAAAVLALAGALDLECSAP